MKKAQIIHSHIGGWKEISSIGNVINLAWPCDLYTISIQRERDDINIFEKAVLRLLANGLNKPEKISKQLCIDEDLVHFIVHRLETKALVDSDKLSEEGKKYIQGYSQYEEASAFMYLDAIGGNLLPFITLESPKLVAPDPEKSGYYLEATGDDRLLEPYFLRRNQVGNRVKFSLNTSEVIERIKEYFKIRKLTLPLNTEKKDIPNLALREASIRAQPNPSKVYLHCVVKLSLDGQDMLVWNPFGYNAPLPILSHELAQCSSEQYDDIKKKLLERVQNRQSTPNTIKDQITDTPYPEVMRYYFQAEQAFKEIDSQTNDNSRNVKVRQFLISTYAALEFLLRHWLQDFGTNDFNNLLCQSNAQSNSTLIEGIATKLGFDVKPLEFSGISPKEIDKCLQGKISFLPLLALALVSASVKEEHPLAILAPEMPDLITRAKLLKNLRDNVSHGNSQRTAKEELSDIHELTLGMLGKWHPELLQPLHDLNAEDKNEMNNSAMDSLAVEKALLAYFPQKVRNRFSADLNKELRISEQLLQQHGVGSKMDEEILVSNQSVMGLYGFCQRLLLEKCGSKPSNGNFMEEAKKRALQAGFTLSDKQLPEGLRHTTKEAVTQALAHKNTTLGANCITFLLSTDETELKRVASYSPAFLQDIGNLVYLRGHVNKQIKLGDAISIRDAIYKDCAVIFGE